jgi:hypothetical protein|tara:strand:+ start:597 stop:776 length:180 start_codon:yes stop_codon:yes gene_type:complete
MISYELLDEEEVKILKMLIDPLKWDDVLTEYGSETALERELDFIGPHELDRWKEFWLEE